MTKNDDNQFVPESESLSFPDDTVVGIVNEPDDVTSALEALIGAGVAEEDIRVLCGDPGVRRLDPSGERHGLLGKLHRIIQLFGDQEVAHVQRQAAELREGNFLIAVPAESDAEAEEVAAILKSHNGHFINLYTGMTVRALEP